MRQLPEDDHLPSQARTAGLQTIQVAARSEPLRAEDNLLSTRRSGNAFKQRSNVPSHHVVYPQAYSRRPWQLELDCRVGNYGVRGNSGQYEPGGRSRGGLDAHEARESSAWRPLEASSADTVLSAGTFHAIGTPVPLIKAAR